MTFSAEVCEQLANQAMEVPSWAYGNSGTRFKVFAQPGVPRDPYEKVADAAQVHALTGLAPRIALHIPWDEVEDFGKLREHADGIGRGASERSTPTRSRTTSSSWDHWQTPTRRSDRPRSITTCGASRSCTRRARRI